MRGYNKVIICGNVGGEPSIRQFENGNKVVEISVATSEGGYTNAQGNEVPKVTQWHRVECFGKNAEFASKYVKSGICVLVEGRITYRQYVDKDNNKRSITEIVAERVELMGSGKTTTEGEKAQENENSAKLTAFNAKAQEVASALNADVDDMPF